MTDTNKGNVTRELFDKYMAVHCIDKKAAWDSFYKMSIDLMERIYTARNKSEEM